jgi:EpsI family protein
MPRTAPRVPELCPGVAVPPAGRAHAAASCIKESKAMISWRKSLILFTLMLLTAGSTLALHPTQQLAERASEVQLETLIPAEFGDWRQEIQGGVQIVDPEIQETLDKTYSQVLTRTYVNRQGYRIMLSMAYGKSQRGNLQLHHPEICYPAQGFELHSNRRGQLLTAYGAIPVRRLETQLNRDRPEPLTYWAMIGDQIALGSVERKIVEMRYGLRGVIADGLLFRVSSIEANSTTAFEQQAAFVGALLDALPADARHRVAGV